MKSMTYGTMPAFSDFEKAYESHVGSGTYEIRNCRELEAVYNGGNVDFDLEGLWEFLSECCIVGFDNHEALDIASCIMTTLGFEWV